MDRKTWKILITCEIQLVPEKLKHSYSPEKFASCTLVSRSNDCMPSFDLNDIELHVLLLSTSICLFSLYGGKNDRVHCVSLLKSWASLLWKPEPNALLDLSESTECCFDVLKSINGVCEPMDPATNQWNLYLPRDDLVYRRIVTQEAQKAHHVSYNNLEFTTSIHSALRCWYSIHPVSARKRATEYHSLGWSRRGTTRKEQGSV